MAAQTGRTSNRYINFKIDDSGGTLRQIPVDADSIKGLGLIYERQDLSAIQDAAKGGLPGQPDFELSWSGPLDSTALTGSLTVLSAIVGGSTPLTFDVQVGIRHTWEAGEPQFGITSDATNGIVVDLFEPDLSSMTYNARAHLFPGSAVPAWGTAAET